MFQLFKQPNPLFLSLAAKRGARQKVKSLKYGLIPQGRGVMLTVEVPTIQSLSRAAFPGGTFCFRAGI
jgi:hypothetical protein